MAELPEATGLFRIDRKLSVSARAKLSTVTGIALLLLETPCADAE